MTHLLTYITRRGASSQPKFSKSDNWWSMRFWSPVLVGVSSALVLVPVIIGLAGGGHGTLWPLAVLFPYAVVAAAITDQVSSPMWATAVGLTLTVVQLPLYGALIGSTLIEQSRWLFVWLALVAHAMLAGAVLLYGDYL